MRGRIYAYAIVDGKTVKSSTKLPGGSWAYEFAAPNPDAGTINPRTGNPWGSRRFVGKGGFATRKEAQQALTVALSGYQLGGAASAPIKPSTMPLLRFLLDEWLPAVQHNLKPSTIENYRTLARCYVRQHPIAATKLCDITAGQLGAFYAMLAERGSRTGGPLSSRTVMHVSRMLNTALEWAVEAEAIRTNPCRKIPRATRRRATSTKVEADQFWTQEQARQFLASVRDDELYPLWLTALSLGLRKGELLGLRWSDVDLDDARVTIRRNRVKVGTKIVEGPPKTESSKRSIGLDTDLAAVLRKYRKEQAERKMRLPEGVWQGGGDWHVFCRADGSPLRPDGVYSMFRGRVAKAGLPQIGVHGLRHTHATIGLTHGVPMKVMQERLGHSSISITGDTYSHVVDSMRYDASAVIGAALGLGS